MPSTTSPKSRLMAVLPQLSLAQPTLRTRATLGRPVAERRVDPRLPAGAYSPVWQARPSVQPPAGWSKLGGVWRNLRGCARA